ncbi:hypothetical protein [Burkholderia vietnamiensis]|uniref:hypothetical protein n=1 Tax=Burkholderia vietnamiensis TaxID=60552 RepID=UPI000A4743C8|nr:hypothetical protein [Burkholderia vietnamiensis]
MTTDNEKGPLNQMESGQQKRSASEARALSEIVNGTPSENLCRRGSPAPKQASETTAQQPRTYTTQPAESVMGIALRQCGNEMEWRHILACNPEFARMLPHEYFPVGTVLNLPPHPAAASPVEQPEKSLAPGGGSEAEGRWIQANCPTGDIIESPSPSNNREFPTSMSENDCEHRIALAPSQSAAAAIENAELASVTRMFHAACADLGLINEALGLDPEDGGAAPILEAIEELKARAASANETGAKGADALAHEVWSAAQRASGEGIEDAVQRIAAILSRSPAMAAEAVDWRELSRRLYVELFHCDQQMRSTRDEEGEPHWTQSAVVRDVLADAKAVLEAAPQPPAHETENGLNSQVLVNPPQEGSRMPALAPLELEDAAFPYSCDRR